MPTWLNTFTPHLELGVHVPCVPPVPTPMYSVALRRDFETTTKTADLKIRGHTALNQLVDEAVEC